MVGLGLLFMLLGLAAVYYIRKPEFVRRRWFLWVMLAALPLPYAACELGWVAAEVGRQPWIIYGVLRTASGVSASISTAQVLSSLVGLGLIYSGLTITDIYLLTKFAKKGPDEDLARIISPEKLRRPR